MGMLIYKAKELPKNDFIYPDKVSADDSLYACACLKTDIDFDYAVTVPILYYRLCILCFH